MKKIIGLFVLYLLIGGNIFGQYQSKNILGISAGIVPGIMQIYIDKPFNYWPNREISPIYHLFYARQVSESFRIGSYYEYEKAKYSDNVDNNTYGFDRYNLGVNWLGQFPKSSLCLQLGGYLGYGFLKAQNWDNLTGIDLGLIAGPAFERNKIGFAVHLHGGHAVYRSSGSPSGVMLYTPKLLLKVCYKL